MADGTSQGNVDPQGLTLPGELHLEITPPDGASTTGLAGFDLGSVPWWLWAAGAVVVYLIVKR